MLVNRIIGAFEFRPGIYREVEEDTTWTKTAWILVVVSSLLNQLGSHAGSNVLNWLGSTIVGTITSVLGFALAAWIINRVGGYLFGADVTFEELVRTLGLASVWNAVGILGILASFIGALNCLLAPIMLAAAVALVIAWFVAAKTALDLEWPRAIFTVILGWIVFLVIVIMTNVILNWLGLGSGALGGIIGF